MDATSTASHELLRYRETLREIASADYPRNSRLLLIITGRARVWSMLNYYRSRESDVTLCARARARVYIFCYFVRENPAALEKLSLAYVSSTFLAYLLIPRCDNRVT